MNKRVQTTSSLQNGPLFIYGIDPDGKPRGARYNTVRDDLINAAFDLKCRIVRPIPDQLATIAAKLPLGRIYASGKAFIPIIKRPLYDKLKEAHSKYERVEEKERKITAADISRGIVQSIAQSDLVLGKKAVGNKPVSWEAITVGDEVLALISPDDGWWSCVIAERDGDLLTLRYSDYPKKPVFVRHISTIARVYPGGR